MNNSNNISSTITQQAFLLIVWISKRGKCGWMNDCSKFGWNCWSSSRIFF